MDRKKLILIDGHSIINRAFYGIPDLTNSEGVHTNAIYGFLNIMFKAIREEKPAYLAVAFDEHAPTFRHKIYEAYKGTRKPMPEELREQVPLLRRVLEAMQIPCVSVPGLEADDILGTLALKGASEGLEVDLISGDRDLLQIAREHVRICIPTTRGGKTFTRYFHEAELMEEYHVTPQGFIELKALMGDTSDNIPGVSKVGEKTAQELMATYGSLSGIYEHVEEISKKSIRESLIANRHLAELSLTLATIKTDCELPFSIDDAAIGNLFTPEAYELIKHLELKSFLAEFDEANKKQTQVKRTDMSVSSLEDLQDILHALPEEADLGLCLLTQEDALYGICAASYSGEEMVSAWLPLFPGQEEKAGEMLRKELQEVSFSRKVALCNVKEAYPYLGLEGNAALFDCIIGAYLLNPLKSDHDAESIAKDLLGWTLPGRKELFGKQSLSELTLSGSDAPETIARNEELTCLRALPVIEERLQNTGMDGIMRDMEMPLSKVLYDMERIGVPVRGQELADFSAQLGLRIAELEKQIHEAAGETFNIQSPKQLGEILFDRMKLPGGKKTKTGYSTAADVLEKLAPDVPFVASVLEYRALTKLKSTYADGLPAYIAADGRIHCHFNQTITATGRISSSDPNLQNIPIRTELGRELRKVFTAREGWTLVDADYSQIELRILASLSGDEGLIEAYRSSKDIHRITASKVFGIPFDEVTDLQRRNAKAVNFGIVYGISSFGLSQDLSITRKEAADYIEQYFATYPGIKRYLDHLVTFAKEKGYALTYFGRRRPVPELSSSNFMQRSFGERVAMNAPIQGTAADIIKIAMVGVDRSLRAGNLKSRLVLQVHDELLVEADENEIGQVQEIIRREMEGAADMKVRLEIDMHTGGSWYEAH